MKRITRKFYAVVVQDNDKEMQKKSVLHVQSCCCFFLLLLMRRIVFFLFACLFCRSRCLRRLALHDCIFIRVNYQVQ